MPRLHLPPKQERAGKPGEQGPFGVASRLWMVQARVSQGFELEVVYPARQDGSFDNSKAPYPIITFIHGGFVPAGRYRWLAIHFASRGYLVLMPSHLADLAITEGHNASLALDRFYLRAKDPEDPFFKAVGEGESVSVMGHSLGGVIGTWRWLDDTRFTALALLASLPAEGDPVQRRAGMPVISIVGKNDKRASPEEVLEGFKKFEKPRLYAVVDGMNHYDWTDQSTPAELSSDGPAARDLEKTRQNMFRLLDTWLDAHLRKEKEALKALETGTFEDIHVQR